MSYVCILFEVKHISKTLIIHRKSIFNRFDKRGARYSRLQDDTSMINDKNDL